MSCDTDIRGLQDSEMYRCANTHTSDILIRMEHYVNATIFILDCSTGQEIPGLLW